MKCFSDMVFIFMRIAAALKTNFLWVHARCVVQSLYIGTQRNARKVQHTTCLALHIEIQYVLPLSSIWKQVQGTTLKSKIVSSLIGSSGFILVSLSSKAILHYILFCIFLPLWKTSQVGIKTENFKLCPEHVYLMPFQYLNVQCFCIASKQNTEISS